MTKNNGCFSLFMLRLREMHNDSSTDPGTVEETKRASNLRGFSMPWKRKNVQDSSKNSMTSVHLLPDGRLVYGNTQEQMTIDTNVFLPSPLISPISPLTVTKRANLMAQCGNILPDSPSFSPTKKRKSGTSLVSTKSTRL
jgi:hypothetical protein